MDKGTGAKASPIDIRNFVFRPTGIFPNMTGGYHYDRSDILDQHAVGICTSIHLVQNALKATGVEYSPDFLYLLQKKYYDGNWKEGSSIFHALKAAKNFGFLPKKYFEKYISERDRRLDYSEYIEKLKAISPSEITNLLTKCEKRLVAYEAIEKPLTRDKVATAIDESTSGVLVRYVIGEEWYTRNRIDKEKTLLPYPREPVSGHALVMSEFYGNIFTLSNTWGPDWNLNGNGDIDFLPTEAWIPHYDIVPDRVQKLIDKKKTIAYKAISLLQALIKQLQK